MDQLRETEEQVVKDGDEGRVLGGGCRAESTTFGEKIDTI